MKIKNFIYILIISLIFLNQAFADIFFSEIFPNTIDDKNLEYVELYNFGIEEFSLSGVVLSDKSGKEYMFSDTEILQVGEKKKYLRTLTKIILNNSDEELYIKDIYGNIIDSFSYSTTIKGESISCILSTLQKEENTNTGATSTGIIDNDTENNDTENNDTENNDTENNDIENNNTENNDTENNDTENNDIENNNTENNDTENNDIENNDTENNDTENNDTENNDTENNDTENNDTENNDTNTGVTDIIEIPEVVYNFQSATYLLNKDKILETYICDSSKELCKINLDFRNSFVGNFSENDYKCETDFMFTNDQENKCNPATIIVPVGTYDFKIKIVAKENLDNYSEVNFKIINNGYNKPIKKIKTVKKSTSTSKKPDYPIEPIIISTPEIIVQSGLNNKNICINKNNCNVNFKYTEKSKFEKCKWDFGGGIYKPGINFKCDPGYVKYGTGEFEVSIRVYEKGDYFNFKTTKIIFWNGVKLNSNSNSNFLPVEKGISGIQIYGVMPNPKGSDNFEFIELKNNTNKDFNLKGCILDDILDGGTKEYIFKEDEFLKSGEVRKYLKEITKLNLNNDEDEVNLFCNNKLIDTLKWDFDIKSGYYLDHTKLDITSGIAKVIDVIDGDTIKIQFLNSDIIENFRLVGIDTPETKDPHKGVEKYGIEASEFTKKNLKGKEIFIELDLNNLRDTYSRLLGFVYLDGENFNKKIIENGFSKAYLDYDFEYKKDFIKAEKLAKESKVGIWSSGIEKEIGSNVNDIINNDIINNDILKSKITIQGKIGNNKNLSGNKITCYDTCSINFDGRESKGNIKKYSWDFGNGEKFEGDNPGYIKYEKYGNYKVYLATVSDAGKIDIEEFYVIYIKTTKKEKISIITKVNAEEDIYVDIKNENIELSSIDKEEYNSYSFLLYIIISIFGVLISVVILKREKLI